MTTMPAIGGFVSMRPAILAGGTPSERRTDTRSAKGTRPRTMPGSPVPRSRMGLRGLAHLPAAECERDSRDTTLEVGGQPALVLDPPLDDPSWRCLVEALF